jgi:hypothetical protein
MKLLYLALAVVLPFGALGTSIRSHAPETRPHGHVTLREQLLEDSSSFIAGLGPKGVHSPSNAAASTSAAAAAADLWRQHYDAAKQFKADFKQSPRATANKCR